MKTKVLSFVWLLIAAMPLAAQSGVHSYERSFTTTAEVVTLVYAASTGGRVQMQGLTVYCAAACTFTLERGGTGPTGTAATANEVNQSSNTTHVTPYHTSDVASTTTIKTYNVAAGEEKSVDLKSMTLRAGQKLTVRTSSATGRIYLQWGQY